MKVVHVLRKPCSESTVAANVLRWGTGALNIDAARVAHANPSDLDAHRKMVEAIKARGGSMANSWKNSSDLSGANDVSTGGRWPANLILQHLDGCVQDRTETVAAWACASGCPVAALDAQSGNVKGAVSNGKKAGTGYEGGFRGQEQAPGYGDTGGASRFFKQVKP